MPRRGSRSQAWSSGTPRAFASAEIWTRSPAFNAFRGTDFLPEPCASCERREIDFGGCRCQAFLLTGDARATDPVCHKSPHHMHVTTELCGVCRKTRPYDYRRCKVLAAIVRHAESIARSLPICSTLCARGPHPCRVGSSALGRRACRFRRHAGVVFLRRKPCAGDDRCRGRVAAQPGFSPMDKSNPADEQAGYQSRRIPTPPIAPPVKPLPLDKIKLPQGFKAEALFERPSRRPHHGDGPEGHHLHGHPPDRPRLCDHQQGRQARSEDPAARA